MLPIVAIPHTFTGIVILLAQFTTLGPAGPVEPQWLGPVAIYACLVFLSLALGFALAYGAQRVRAVHAAAAGLLGGTLLIVAAAPRHLISGSGLPSSGSQRIRPASRGGRDGTRRRARRTPQARTGKVALQ